MSDQVRMHDLQVYLRTMFGFIKGFENVVFPLLANVLPQLETRRKAHLFAVDLRLTSEASNELSALPESTFTNYYTNISTAWGAMYVLEGSTLGGQIIIKHLRKYLGESISDNTHYLAPYGAETGAMWQTFLHYFTESATTECNQEEIIESAIHTFSLMNHWMTSSNK